jgi:hypothetical protein
MTTKSCKICKNRYELSEFYKNPNHKDGLLPQCKSCVLKYDRERIEKHPGPKTTGTKICSSCKEIKPVTEYTKRLRSRDGLRNRCRSCDITARKIYEQKHPSQRFLARIRQKYGLETDMYLEMLKAQQYKCKICGNKDKLVVDHCHNTLKIRGLLCNLCNSGLGMYQDNIENLKSAIKYLEG